MKTKQLIFVIALFLIGFFSFTYANYFFLEKNFEYGSRYLVLGMSAYVLIAVYFIAISLDEKIDGLESKLRILNPAWSIFDTADLKGMENKLDYQELENKLNAVITDVQLFKEDLEKIKKKTGGKK